MKNRGIFRHPDTNHDRFQIKYLCKLNFIDRLSLMKSICVNVMASDQEETDQAQRMPALLVVLGLVLTEGNKVFNSPLYSELCQSPDCIGAAHFVGALHNQVILKFAIKFCADFSLLSTDVELLQELSSAQRWQEICELPTKYQRKFPEFSLEVDTVRELMNVILLTIWMQQKPTENSPDWLLMGTKKPSNLPTIEQLQDFLEARELEILKKRI